MKYLLILLISFNVNAGQFDSYKCSDWAETFHGGCVFLLWELVFQKKMLTRDQGKDLMTGYCDKQEVKLRKECENDEKNGK